MQSKIFSHLNSTNLIERLTHFLMAFSSTPFSLSEDFCTQSYSADDIVTLAMSYIYSKFKPKLRQIKIEFETLLRLLSSGTGLLEMLQTGAAPRRNG